MFDRVSVGVPFRFVLCIGLRLVLRSNMRLATISFLAPLALPLPSCALPPQSCFVATSSTHATGDASCTASNSRRFPPRMFVLPQKQLDNDERSDGSDEETSAMRRSFVATTAALFASLLATPPANAAQQQPRVKGAAEYDLEYYVRDLVKGNTKEGNLPASSPPPAPPARTLQGPLLPLLLDNNYEGCIPVKVLSEVSGKPVSSVAALAKDYRDKSSKAFAAKAQWKISDISDQYYFDLSAYALWRAAAELIANYVKRDQFAKDVGRGIYSEAAKAGLVKKKALILDTSSSDDGSSDDSSDDDSSDDTQKKKEGKTKKANEKSVGTGTKEDSSDDSSNDAPLGPLTGTIPAILEILELYKSCGFISRYQLGGEDETRRGKNVFDELDDDDIASGSSVDCLVSIYEPAILSGALQITGEGSRFAPDFVGQTLSAAWEAAGILAKEETYFVDSVYRPNPKDFFPDERLIQFTLRKA